MRGEGCEGGAGGTRSKAASKVASSRNSDTRHEQQEGGGSRKQEGSRKAEQAAQRDPGPGSPSRRTRGKQRLCVVFNVGSAHGAAAPALKPRRQRLCGGPAGPRGQAGQRDACGVPGRGRGRCRAHKEAGALVAELLVNRTDELKAAALSAAVVTHGAAQLACLSGRGHPWRRAACMSTRSSRAGGPRPCRTSTSTTSGFTASISCVMSPSAAWDTWLMPST